MSAPPARIGELLVEAGFLSARDVDAALKAQTDHANAGRQRKLGQLLLSAGRITGTQLTQTLGMQLSVPWASLTHVEFEPSLLERVPAELAQLYKLIPVFVRKVRGQGETLYVAMEDPTNDRAIAEVSARAKLPVKAMIASPTDVARAIRLHYFGETPDDDGPVIEVSELEIPLKPRAQAAGSASSPPPPPSVPPPIPPSPSSKITLLDGTSFEVPRRKLPSGSGTATGTSDRPSSLPPPSRATPSKPPPPPPSASMKSAPPAPIPDVQIQLSRVIDRTMSFLTRKNVLSVEALLELQSELEADLKG